MSEPIEEYDNKGNCVYLKTNGYEYWSEYDENNRIIHWKNSVGEEQWWEYGEDNWAIEITEQKLKEIEFKKQEKEFLSRNPISRFRLMDI